MDKKSILAFVLIAAIFLIYMYFNAPKPPPVQPQETVQADSLQIDSETSRLSETPDIERDTEISEKPIEIEMDSLEARFATVPAETATVETDRYIAKFYGRGGGLVSFRFKKYFYHNGDTSMVEMVPDWAQSTLNFQFPDAGRDGFDLQKIVFTPNKANIKIGGGSTDKLIFRADISEHDFIEITYTFYGDRFDFDVKLDFEGAANQDLGRSYLFGWDCGLESTEKNRVDDFNSFKAVVMWDTGKEQYKKFDHGQMSHSLKGTPKWIATRSKYFLVGIDPERDPEGVLIAGKEIKVNKSAGQPGMKRIDAQVEMAIHERKSSLFDKYSVYIGPIDYNILKSYNNGFHQAVDLGGILSPISLGLLWLMDNLHKVFHNYGLVIIIFSILIKVVFYPLTARSLRSMKRMQELQPKLKALQEKYKQEPQKMNAEVMKLWKTNKVNPMGGCLLMLPQMPIFFALFTVFRNTILLRGSEFIFWMKDLSQPDTTMILPLIMAGTMFLQQKMTMQDPKQKMLVYILPIVFFFLFKGFSTGLVLYWTMYNILSVFETIFIRKPQQQKDKPAVVN
jgi:YidC/Oxa1 family membrane protein insertase